MPPVVFEAEQANSALLYRYANAPRMLVKASRKSPANIENFNITVHPNSDVSPISAEAYERIFQTIHGIVKADCRDHTKSCATPRPAIGNALAGLKCPFKVVAL